MPKTSYEPWPELSYEQLAPTGHLLHMTAQIMGKLKLATPFEPEWANVALWVTSRGVTTGPIPNGDGTFAVALDLVDHRIDVSSSWGASKRLRPVGVLGRGRVPADLRSAGGRGGQRRHRPDAAGGSVAGPL